MTLAGRIGTNVWVCPIHGENASENGDNFIYSRPTRRRAAGMTSLDAAHTDDLFDRVHETLVASELAALQRLADALAIAGPEALPGNRHPTRACGTLASKASR